MSTATLNLPYAPGADNPGALRAFVLAAVVHCVLVGFLYFGIRWQSAPPEIYSAELWTPPQTIEVQAPAPKVEAPVEPPKTVQPPEPPAPVVKPDIAEKIEKKKPEVKPPPKVEKAPSAAEEMARQAAAEEMRSKAQSEISKSASAANTSATQNQNWLRAVNSHIERRFVFDGSSVSPNLEVRFEITLAQSLNILSVRLLKSSGNAGFDAAAQRAIENSSPLPPPASDKVDIPRTIEIPMRPKKT